jgi:hypothetical protein
MSFKERVIKGLKVVLITTIVYTIIVVFSMYLDYYVIK